MKRLSMLLASSALMVSAHGVNWVEVSESSSGSIFSIDLDSIESSDINIIDEKDVENITVSMLRTYPAQQIKKEKTAVKDKDIVKDKGTVKDKAAVTEKSDIEENSIHRSDQQLLISCKDASYYKRAYVNYDANDKVLKSWQSEKPILTTKDFKVTAPKTVGRRLIEHTCELYEQDKQQPI